MKKYHPFWFFVYNAAVIPVLFVGMHVARLFNAKVHEGIRGRKGLFGRLRRAGQALEPGRRFVVIHCSSAGEFEAARPVLERMRRRLPHLKAHVTCYSPSGMRSLEKAQDLESYSYLPFDDLNSARRFFNALNPLALLIVKHDVWPNMVCTAARRGIPVLWINANLHSHTRRTGWLFRGLNRAFLQKVDRILTVGDDHALRFARLVSPQQVEVNGDSRYDRIVGRWTQANGAAPDRIPQDWLKAHKIIVGGSTWGPDQRVLIPAFALLKKDFPTLRLVLVPHEPKPRFLEETGHYLDGHQLTYTFYSKLNGHGLGADVLIVDQVGILASLYRTAWAAYVGGAFGEGVHSVLEPALFSLPIFFGPRYYMAHEAYSLMQRGGAWSVKSVQELEEKLRILLLDDSTREAAGQASGQLLKSGMGATDRIVDCLEKFVRQRWA